MISSWIDFFSPSQELDREQILELVAYIVDEGVVSLSDHARQRMVERNFTMSDLCFILKNGSLAAKEYSENSGNWKYRISGVDTDGEDGTVVTAIISNRRQMIVTVF